MSEEEPDQIDMMSESELRSELRSVVIQLAAITAERDAAEKQEPIGYVDGAQFERWATLRGTEFESPERCYIPFSVVPFETEDTRCDFPLYANPIPSPDTAELIRKAREEEREAICNMGDLKLSERQRETIRARKDQPV